MKTKLTKNSILMSILTQSAYGIQIDGGRVYCWVASKREAARIAWRFASAGWPTIIKGDGNAVILKLN